MLLLALACTKPTPGTDSGGGDSGLELPCGGDGYVTMYSDVDRDGYGAGDATEACADDVMFADNADDCDDADAEVFPGATEVCNEVDDDCDGDVDEEMTAIFYEDRDSDGYGSDVTTEACTAPSGFTDVTGDCDDGNGGVFPGADELCNDRDDDCDDEIDEDAIDAVEYLDDVDGDGHAGTDTTWLCDAPSWGGDETTDCDDANPDVNPDAAEVCNNAVDDDCDGATDTNSAYFEAADGTLSNATADVTGTYDAPATPTFSDEGDLVFCEGTYYLNATVENHLVVRSLDDDPDGVELNGGLAGSILDITTDEIEVGIGGVTFDEGYGSGLVFDIFGYGATGGGVSCYASGSAVYVENSVFQNGVGDLGAGIASQGCDLYIDGTTFQDNSADWGAAILVDAAEVEITDSTFTANEATNAGGVLYAIGYVDGRDTLITFEDSVLSENIADAGAAIAIDTGGWVEVTGTSAGAAAITDNTCDSGSVVLYGYDAMGFTADTVDFGTVDGGDDNTTYDITNDTTGFAWMPEDEASFECDMDACGESLEYTLGTDSYSSDLSADGFVAQIVYADVPATLDSYEIYLEDVDNCDVTLQLLSGTSDTGTSWTVEWTGSTTSGSSTDGWFSSGDIGEPVVAGTYYAFGIGYQCDTAPSHVYDIWSATGDAGLGDDDGALTWDSSYTSVYSGTATTEVSTTGASFYTNINVTEL